MKLYRPSNGTEGCGFIECWCDLCEHEQGNRQCKILTNTMAYDIKDKEYPKEWIYADNGLPICTAFKRYDPRPTERGSRDYLDERQGKLF